MRNVRSLSHSVWECQYHIVFIPKYRRKELYGELRIHFGNVFRDLARQRESQIDEGHLMPDFEFAPRFGATAVRGLARFGGARKTRCRSDSRARSPASAPAPAGRLKCCAHFKLGHYPSLRAVDSSFEERGLEAFPTVGRPRRSAALRVALRALLLGERAS